VQAIFNGDPDEVRALIFKKEDVNFQVKQLIHLHQPFYPPFKNQKKEQKTFSNIVILFGSFLCFGLKAYFLFKHMLLFCCWFHLKA
jgi:hypothetical protein